MKSIKYILEGLLDDDFEKDLDKHINIEFISFLEKTWSGVKWESAKPGSGRPGIWSTASTYKTALEALKTTNSNISKLLRKYKIPKKVAQPKFYNSSGAPDTTIISWWPTQERFCFGNPARNKAFCVQEGTPILKKGKYYDFVQVQPGVNHGVFWTMVPGPMVSKSEWYELPGWAFELIKEIFIKQ